MASLTLIHDAPLMGALHCASELNGALAGLFSCAEGRETVRLACQRAGISEKSLSDFAGYVFDFLDEDYKAIEELNILLYPRH